MSQYTDTILINCNRKAGVEARAGNDSDPATWINPLQQSVIVEVGDKISMESVFINEIGSANSQTIEFSGRQVKSKALNGQNNIPTYTQTEKRFEYNVKTSAFDPNYRLGKYRQLISSEVTGQSIPLQDNISPLIYGYYITSSEYPQYIQQPRLFAQDQDVRGAVPNNSTIHTALDSTAAGLPTHTVRIQIACEADWKQLPMTQASGVDGARYQQFSDNTRFTVYVRDNITFVAGLENAENQFPIKSKNGIFSEATYYRLRDRLDLKLDAGFSTPSSVASKITDQLTETSAPEIFDIYDSLGFVQNITQTISSKTYKPIEAQNYYHYNTETYDLYSDEDLDLPITALTNTQNLTDYISSFGYIGVKRPEIWESGRIMGAITYPSISKDGINPGDPAIEITSASGDPDDGFQVLVNIDLTAVDPKRELQNLVTNIPFTRENISKIRDYLDAQGLYPELWSNIENTTDFAEASKNTLEPTHANSRFFHINGYPSPGSGAAQTQPGFGTDNFVPVSPAVDNFATGIVMFDWDESSRDKWVEPESYIAGSPPVYGFAIPFKTVNALGFGLPDEVIYVIQLNTETISIPRSIFHASVIEPGRRIGFDFHSTAFSTCVVTPYCGRGNADLGTLVEYKSSVTGASEIERISASIPFLSALNNQTLKRDISPYFTQTYMGANNPALTYNTVTNRFELLRLHTANNAGNKEIAGDPAASVTSESVTPIADSNVHFQLAIEPPGVNVDAGNTVYKINPRIPQFGYSPAFKPYGDINAQKYINMAYPATANANASASGGPNRANMQLYEADNINIDGFSIFDSHGGIYIDHFGYSEEDWQDKMWDILGFSYDAVASPASVSNVLTRRMNNENGTKLYRPTTNAEVVSTDSKAYITNRYGANQYYTNLPYPATIINNVALGSAGFDATQFRQENPILSIKPEVVIKTQSTTITATNIQKSVLKPYYAVRSSLLEGATAIGGSPTGANLPIIAVVDKYSAQGDFYFGKGAIDFTATKQTIVSDITTSITDPDGEYSNIDLSSAVIYKIQKLRAAPQNIFESILESEKKK